MNKCAIIGTGVAGLAAAIRMRMKGYEVDVYESNDFPGGKLSSETHQGYRFDMGPSVFTMPQLIDELFQLAGKNPRDYFSYQQLDPVYHYFYEDGSSFVAPHGKEAFAKALSEHSSDSVENILSYLNHTQLMYDLTAEVFLYNSLHKLKNFFTKHVFRGLINFGKIGAFDTMNGANQKAFNDHRLVQLFNRYATYNGSSPYLAPATLNVIPAVEIIQGAYLPKGGMFSITKALVQLGKDLGINYYFSSKVERILHSNKKVSGVLVNGIETPYNQVISNMDINKTYSSLLQNVKVPTKILNQPKSSSGIIFYWGINREFPQFGLHNILFAENYEAEFDAMFNQKSIYEDPTIYLNITSKYCKEDAPSGCENWFVFVNVPNNEGQDWDSYIAQTKQAILAKFKRMFSIDLEQYIETEDILDPRRVESRTSGFRGAIYGNSSNNKFAAFLRHPNFSKEISGLYFCGGSVHPGPSVPLSVLSAKIATGFAPTLKTN